jgi:hypothetical protein
VWLDVRGRGAIVCITVWSPGMAQRPLGDDARERRDVDVWIWMRGVRGCLVWWRWSGGSMRSCMRTLGHPRFGCVCNVAPAVWRSVRCGAVHAYRRGGRQWNRWSCMVSMAPRTRMRAWMSCGLCAGCTRTASASLVRVPLPSTLASTCGGVPSILTRTRTRSTRGPACLSVQRSGVEARARYPCAAQYLQWIAFGWVARCHVCAGSLFPFPPSLFLFQKRWAIGRWIWTLDMGQREAAPRRQLGEGEGCWVKGEGTRGSCARVGGIPM